MTVWIWIVDWRRGLLNWALVSLGVEGAQGHNWLAEPLSFLVIASVIVTWMSVPFVALSLYAGLTQVSPEVLEAATIDGAGWWQRLRHIILPLVAPVLSIVMLLQLIWDLRVFTQIKLLQDAGSVASETDLLGTYIYRPRHRPGRLRHRERGQRAHPPAHRRAQLVLRPLAHERGGVMRRSRTTRTLLTVLGLALAVVWAFPVYWMLNSSFLPNVVLQTDDADLPAVQRLARQPAGRRHRPLLRARARHLARRHRDHRGGGAARRLPRGAGDQPVPVPRAQASFVLALLLVQMLPAEGLFIAQYKMMSSLGLLNQALGLAVLYTATVVPFTIWMLRGFVAGVPADLEEAAMVDGCSRTQAFLRITFPLLAPGLVASGVYAFLQAWNEFTRGAGRHDRGAVADPAAVAGGFVQATPAARPTGAGHGRLDARRGAGHRLLPPRPGPDEQRPRRRGGEGMSLAADAAAVLQPGFAGSVLPEWLVDARAAGLARCACSATTSFRTAAWPPCARSCATGSPACWSPSTRRAATSPACTTRRGPPTVGNAVLGRLDDVALTRAVGRAIGAELAALGIGLDLAPVVDVNSTPDNPVIGVAQLRGGPGAGGAARRRLGRGAAVDRRGRVRQALPRPRRHRRRLPPRPAPPRRAARALRERELLPFAAAIARRGGGRDDVARRRPRPRPRAARRPSPPTSSACSATSSASTA